MKDTSDQGNEATSVTVEDVMVSLRTPSPTTQSDSGSSSLEEVASLDKFVQLEPEANHDKTEIHNLVSRDFYIEDSSKVDVENKQERLCNKVDTESDRSQVLADSLEVLIGSISIAVEDPCLVGSGLTHSRSVDDIKNSLSKDTMREQLRHEKNDNQSENGGSYGKSDSGLGMGKEPSVAWRNMVAGPRLFSYKDASAFLALRWREAIASDHVTLVLPPEREAPGLYPDDFRVLGQCKNSSAEEFSGRRDPADMVSRATPPKPKSRK